MTSKASSQSDDVTIRVQPKASEEWIAKIPKAVGDYYFDGVFELEVHPERLTIPRNGSVTFKIINPTDKFQEVSVGKKEEQLGYTPDQDYWILGGHKKKLIFVLAPKSSRDVQMEHGDNVNGTEYVRELVIGHTALKTEEAKGRSEELENPVIQTKIYEVYPDEESGMNENIWLSTNKKTWFDYEARHSTGSYHLKVKIDPEPPVTSEELKKDPIPRGKPRKAPKDPLAKKEKDRVIKDRSWCGNHCCCCCR